MKIIRLNKTKEKIIGALRCSDRVYEIVSAMADAQNVTKQEIIRAILEEVIDEVKFNN